MSSFFNHQNDLVGKLLNVFEGTDITNYGYVYKTTNLLNNRIYIGQRKGMFNPKYLGSGLILRQAVDKYGSDNFKVELLAYAKDPELLHALEKSHIAKVKKDMLQNAYYNIADGGNGGPTRTGYITSEETKAKMRHPHGPLSDEAKKNHHPAPNPEGTRWMYNANSGITLRVKEELVQQYLDAGWIFKRINNGNFGVHRSDDSNNRLWHTGRRKIYNEMLNQYKFVSKDDVEQYLSNGWILVRNIKRVRRTKKN